jgi:tetratricopeptide (TPR) repeat protein
MFWNVLICSLTLAGFKEANALYDAGNFADATTAYERIEPKTANIYFNLGNAYFRQGRLGAAILSYQRARRLAPRDPDILANLRFAQQRAGVEMLNTPAQPVRRFLWSVVQSRTTNGWAAYEFVALWFCVVTVGVAVLSCRLRMGALVIASVFGCTFVCAATALSWQTYSQRIESQAIIISKTEARFAPLADSTVHFQLTEGTSVAIRENRGQWLFVERVDGQQGWTQSAAVAPL